MAKGRHPPPARAPGVHVTTIYSAQADMPLVELEIHGHPQPKTQMTIAQARQVALSLLEACEAAQGDAFMVRFFRDELQISPEHAAALLARFRQARAGMDRPANAGPEASSA